MNLQQIRLQTCCLCHSLRTGCLILLWFWLIFLSLFLLAAPFSTFSYPTLVIGVAVIIQVLGLYAIYKEKPMFLWPKIFEVLLAVVFMIYHDYNMEYSIFGAILSIGFELYFAVLYYSLYQQMLENPESLPV